MRKTVTIDDVEYTLETMTAGDGLEIQELVDEAQNQKSPRQKAIERTLRTVAASLRKTVDEVKALSWPTYLELIDHALEVNGMKTEKPQGEAPAQGGEIQAA